MNIILNLMVGLDKGNKLENTDRAADHLITMLPRRRLGLRSGMGLVGAWGRRWGKLWQGLVRGIFSFYR